MRIGKLEAKSKLNKKEGPQKICGVVASHLGPSEPASGERQKPPKGDAIQQSNPALNETQSAIGNAAHKARTTERHAQ